MTSLRILLLLSAICIASLWTCAPTPKKKHGFCKFYVDGSSDTATSTVSGRKKRQSATATAGSGTASGSASGSSSSSSGSGASSGSSASGGAGGSGGSGESGSATITSKGADGKYKKGKKKKNVKCYEYEDGTRDKDATLKPGVTYCKIYKIINLELIVESQRRQHPRVVDSTKELVELLPIGIWLNRSCAILAIILE